MWQAGDPNRKFRYMDLQLIPLTTLRVQQMRKTEAVKNLVEQVLASPVPYTEDIIDDVFHAIESRSQWRQEYDQLCLDLGKRVVNQQGGRWVAKALGKIGLQQVSSRKSTLIDTYSKL